MKKITALFTVLLMLAASSAFAAVTNFSPSFPAFLNGTLDSSIFGKTDANGTILVLSGFGVNGTLSTHSSTHGRTTMTFLSSNSTVAKTKSDILLVNASSLGASVSGKINGTIAFSNSTFTAAPVRKVRAADKFNFNANYTEGVTGLTSYTMGDSGLNGTMYLVPVANHQMMVGFANSSANMTTLADTGHSSRTNTGFTMPIFYANGSFGKVASTSDVWDYYQFGQSNGHPVYVIGQVKINAANGASNAVVKYYVSNGTKVTKKVSDWIPYNATCLSKGSLTLTPAASAKGNRTLIQNSTINEEKNLITGVTNATGEVGFAVMIKNGAVLSKRDLNNRGFKMVYVGSREGNGLGNATAGISSFVFDNDLNVTQGYGVTLTTDNVISGDRGSLGNYITTITKTRQFGADQSNMTNYEPDGSTIAGSFYGKQSADKTFSVGIYEDLDKHSSSNSSYGLAFLVPNTAVTGYVEQAPKGYQYNASMMTLNYVNHYARNNTGYSATALKTQWKNIASDFTPLTDVLGYSVRFTEGKAKTIFYTTQFAITGLGGKIENLRLYKVSPKSSSSWALHYAGSETNDVDGAWWISDGPDGGYNGVTSVLDPTKTYYVNWVIKDDGHYDANGTLPNSIVDPVVLGSVPTSSSSSSSGCVFNPTAGFSLEWLLLMLAPMVAIVRSRFKK